MQNEVEPGRPQMTIWRMHIACWMLKAINTHSEHVIYIAFPLQHSLAIIFMAIIFTRLVHR